MGNIKHGVFFGFILLTLALQPFDLFGQTWRTYIGWEALSAELEGDLADGTGVVVSHVEAPFGGTSGPYLPDPMHPDFLNPDINFVDVSNFGSGISGHATGVGRTFYGNVGSIARGTTDVFVYNANDWINVTTGFSNNGVPALQSFSVQNHSWIGNGAPVSTAQNILARVDYMANVNDLTIVAGTGNSGVTPMFLAPAYNLITVGKTNGTHSTGLTNFYGNGRVKPEIVGPADATSNSTPMVASLATMLRDGANGTNADNNEAIKAIILAGATKTEFPNWSNTSTVPLDFVFGVGELNAYNSYKVLLAGETNGQPTVPPTPAGRLGWDFGTINPGANQVYSIQLAQPADHLSVVLTWNIQVTDGNANPSVFVPATNLPNLNLQVSGPAVLLNSNGATHNVEHIYARNLPAGFYTITVFPDASVSTDFGLAWRAARISDTASTSLNVVTGGSTSGGLTSVATGNNDYLAVQTDPAAGPTDESVVVEFETIMPFNMPNSIQFDMEARASTLNLEQKIEVFNFESGQYETFNTTETTLVDTIFMASVTGDLFRFFNPNGGTIRARVSWRPVGPVFQYPWTVRIDRAAWSLSQ